MNVEIVAEAAQFPEKEYINGIAVAVHVFVNGFVLLEKKVCQAKRRAEN
jgi:hypothetical protein